ncbi:MAG: peptide ABC transporter substrate-binding protein, partial [Chloroflexota bacterium]
LAAVIAGLVATTALVAAPGAAAERPARILMGEPATLDPAAAGDAGSAAVIAQLFEGLTAIDPTRTPRPALAERWELRDGGRTVAFTLRDGLQFSDGSPLSADDVRRSWLRVIDPAAPSPLASLLYDVAGARAYAAGRGDAGSVEIRASGSTLEVRLTRPAGDFPAIAASPTLAVVPPSVGRDAAALRPGPAFVGSGGYLLAAAAPDGLSLKANPRYWAGRPAIDEITLVSDIGGRSPVDVFAAGELDWTPVADYDASWLAYDPDLGSSLRQWADLAVTYYGFETRRPPFDDARVRRAFASAVDWTRIVQLADGEDALPATSMVPPGIPGRSDESFLPAHDPAAARRLLAEAGYVDPATFPQVTMVTGGSGYDEAILTQLGQNLGINIHYESLDFATLFSRLGSQDSPALWALSWIADYPSPNDFLGILLGSGQPNNYGGWSNAAFDTAIADAVGTDDAATARAGYDAAESVLRDEVPTVPVSYGTSAALAREGLLGATANGLGILRLAGLAWADE